MPTNGATIQNMGSCSTSAPKDLKILEVFPFCNANPNWIPKNPKLIKMICKTDILGFGNKLVGGIANRLKCKIYTTKYKK